MKTSRNILIAFILNLFFAIFEWIGGMMIGSAAIISDALHDAGDAVSIGLSWYLEKKSKRPPDEKYTYGCARYSALGGCITALILLMGSAVMIDHAIRRLLSPVAIHYEGMMIFALIGACVNCCAAYFTRGKGSFNQRAVNLHMLEDVLGWAVVLAGSIVMRFTDAVWLDPVMSIGVSLFIGIHALRTLKDIFDLFLEKAPHGMDAREIQAHITAIEGVKDVHHLHLWSLDGQNHCATLHILSDEEPQKIKAAVRAELGEHGIAHATIEMESSREHCTEIQCPPASRFPPEHCCHHHHRKH